MLRWEKEEEQVGEMLQWKELLGENKNKKRHLGVMLL